MLKSPPRQSTKILVYFGGKAMRPTEMIDMKFTLPINLKTTFSAQKQARLLPCLLYVWCTGGSLLAAVRWTRPRYPNHQHVRSRYTSTSPKCSAYPQKARSTTLCWGNRQEYCCWWLKSGEKTSWGIASLSHDVQSFSIIQTVVVSDLFNQPYQNTSISFAVRINGCGLAPIHLVQPGLSHLPQTQCHPGDDCILGGVVDPRYLYFPPSLIHHPLFPRKLTWTPKIQNSWKERPFPNHGVV